MFPLKPNFAFGKKSYERYWLGRSAWGSLMKTSHTITRMIYTPRTSEERAIGAWKRPEQELFDVMTEKNNGIEASSVALEHHLRGLTGLIGEPGLYYDDFYDLVRPLWPQSFGSDYPASPISTVEISARRLYLHKMEQINNHITMNLVLHILVSQPSPEDALGNEGELDLDLDYNVDGAVMERADCASSVSESFWTLVYSAHISRFCTTVWLFLIFLPFQLVVMFGLHSITGALIAFFIYLGFLAAGEEIEQPFGISRPNWRSPRSWQKAKMKHRSMTVVEAPIVQNKHLDK
ncbi:hypothetical protein F5050DRAFT_1710266 [Lentinula boryana]|uniref:Uncharacterized protein n=1 Tax=Lentinula boryana TaxID=40481 RepID=A0ABQ8QJZ3_9AGAR|nr:hypothetical protein F5050DRAFT_1710266 [Lentinula boryana]